MPPCSRRTTAACAKQVQQDSASACREGLGDAILGSIMLVALCYCLKVIVVPAQRTQVLDTDICILASYRCQWGEFSCAAIIARLICVRTQRYSVQL